MRNLKYLEAFFVTLFLTITFSSCEKNPTEDTLQVVSFNISNVTNLNKKITVPNKTGLPTCSDLKATYAIVTLRGGDIVGTQDFRIDILSSLNDGTETQTIKLASGEYKIDAFLVYADDDSDDTTEELIWATPEACSYYAGIWGIVGVTSTENTSCNVPSLGFSVDPFTKTTINVDVLCWKEYSYEEFGFN